MKGSRRPDEALRRRRARHPPGKPGSHGSVWTPGPGTSVPCGACTRSSETRAGTASGPPSACSWTATAIVEADAPGLERDLAGLTLLEAAAVGGETLAVDALANALGPVFRAEPSPGRVAVAMSGGVDSAVALLRSLPNAVGVTLRLWLDPDGPGLRARLLLARERDRGARDVSPARRPARDARPAGGVPPRGGDSVRARLRARRDAEPVHALQRRLPLRRAARLRPARRRRAPRDRPLRARRRARRPAAARPRHRPGEGPELHARRARPAPARARLLPARGAGQGDDPGRGGARGPRRRPAAGEPGGVLPRRRRLPRVPRAARARAAGGRDRGEDGSELGRHDGYWRFTPGQRRGLGLAAAGAALRARHAPVRQRRGRRAARGARAHGGHRARPALRRGRAGRGEAPLPLTGRAGPRRADAPAASGSSSTSRHTASRPARRRCSTTATPSSDTA